MTGRRATLVAIVMVAMAACSSAAQPTLSPQATPALAVDTVAVVVTDDLVMRSEPGTGELSYEVGPPLQRGVQLYLVRGPVRAGGSEWYEGMPLSDAYAVGYTVSGWVAAAGQSGEPWIKPLAGAPDCPDTPSTVADLVRLPSGIRLACFSQVPITIQARLYTPGGIEPEGDEPTVIVLTDPQADLEDESGWSGWPEDASRWFLAFIVDPTLMSPDAVSVGAVGEMTGMFDHPDAAGCAANSDDEVPYVPDPPYCRPEFVVTGIESSPAASSRPQTTAALAVDTIAVVVTDDLVTHSLPRPELEYSSEWPLERGTQLYLVRGPVQSFGFEWYEGMPLNETEEEFGWVTAANPSGEPSITPLVDAPDCPDTPSTVADLADLTSGVRLACFRRVPITVQALLYTVGWTASPDAIDDQGVSGGTDESPDALAPIMLYDPQTDVLTPASVLDPASVPPDALTFEAVVEAASDALSPVVEVTGMIDHPDAAGCVRNEWAAERVGSEPDPPYCRPEFVVTGIEPTSATGAGPGFHQPAGLTASGTATLELTGGTGFAPVTNGPIECSSGPDYMSPFVVEAHDLGEVGGGTLRLSLTLFEGDGQDWTGDLELFLDFAGAALGSKQPSWEGSPSVTLADDQVSGTAEFHALPLDPGVDASVRAQWPASLSGKLTWHCEPW